MVPADRLPVRDFDLVGLRTVESLREARRGDGEGIGSRAHPVLEAVATQAAAE